MQHVGPNCLDGSGSGSVTGTGTGSASGTESESGSRSLTHPGSQIIGSSKEEAQKWLSSVLYNVWFSSLVKPLFKKTLYVAWFSCWIFIFTDVWQSAPWCRFLCLYWHFSAHRDWKCVIINTSGQQIIRQTSPSFWGVFSSFILKWLLWLCPGLVR